MQAALGLVAHIWMEFLPWQSELRGSSAFRL